jgi:hypothetical protein
MAFSDSTTTHNHKVAVVDEAPDVGTLSVLMATPDEFTK